MKKQWAGLVLVGAMIVGPLTGSASAASDPVVQVSTSAAVDLSNSGGVQTQVASLVLAKGSWTITSNLSAINFGAGDFVRCGLQSDGTAIDGGATVFLANRVANVVNAGTVVATKKTTITLLCEHDKNAATANQFYIDPGATITAVEGGPIKAPGISASQPTVVEGRSTASTPLAENTFTPVTTIKVPQGKWEVHANGSGVNFSDFDWAYCVVDTSAGSISDNYTEAGTEGTDAAAADLDLEAKVTAPASGATLTLNCDSDFSTTPYIDAGATLIATKTASTVVAVPQVEISDTGGTLTTLATKTMPAGSWRITGEVGIEYRYPNNSVGGVRDFVRCELQANGHIIGSSQTQEMTEEGNIQDIVDSATNTSTKSWTLGVACSHDANNTGTGHWAVDQGDLAAVNQGPIG
jgi:hypothetical protein